MTFQMADQVKNKAATSKSPAKQPNKSGKVGKPGSKPADAELTDSVSVEDKPVTKSSSKSSEAKPAKSAKTDKPSKPAKAGKKTDKKPNIFQRFISYLKNVRLEIKRTTWPTRNELWRMSLIVIGALLFFGITIFGLDTLMTRVVSLYAELVPAPVAPEAAQPELLPLIQALFDLG